VIAEAIQCVRDELNQAMKRRFSSTDDVVVVSNLIEPDGSPTPYAADKLAMFLVNVEREAAGQARALSRVGGVGGSTGLYQPPVFLNLFVMFAATYSGARYAESLKLISAATAFFQARPVFDQQNTPNLDRGIEKLSFELENLTIADLGNLWGVLGGRYVPSVLMRARMVVIDSSQITQQIPAVTRPETGARPVGVV
jgi:hypothetical protein